MQVDGMHSAIFVNTEGYWVIALCYDNGERVIDNNEIKGDMDYTCRGWNISHNEDYYIFDMVVGTELSSSRIDEILNDGYTTPE